MKKFLIILFMLILALSLLAGCSETNNVEKDKNAGTKLDQKKKDIHDFVTIKEIPIINIDKPGAKKINDLFLELKKDHEKRIGNGQSVTLSIHSEAFLNDGIISLVLEIKKGGPGGIYTANYDIENDKEITTKELIEKYNFDPKKLIAAINKEAEIDESKPKEERRFIGAVIDYFVDTVAASIYGDPSEEYLKISQEMQNKPMNEKESYVIENIDKIKAYINSDGKFVFIHRGPLEDEELTLDDHQ